VVLVLMSLSTRYHVHHQLSYEIHKRSFCDISAVVVASTKKNIYRYILNLLSIYQSISPIKILQSRPVVNLQHKRSKRNYIKTHKLPLKDLR
jgi:hypothetical protein